ncbi:MAG: methyltransferase domain-containing protein [Candidatus Limnocylindrales bacterium]
MSGVEAEAAYLEAALLRHGHAGLRGSRVLEIGYGAQPLLIYWLIGNGIDAIGVDLDIPLLRLSPSNIARVVAMNGFERAAKSVGRLLIEGGRKRTALETRLTEVTGQEPRPPKGRLLVADAASETFWNGLGPATFDAVYSLDVLEHVPAATLDAMLRGIAGSLKPGGLAVLRPNVFTGITGGHLHEWYRDEVVPVTAKSTDPWEHLRSKRVKANTYLNELSRRAYVQLFERHFYVLEDAPVEPELGRNYLTDSMRRELADWDEYELMSNQVTFVLRPRAVQPLLGDLDASVTAGP